MRNNKIIVLIAANIEDKIKSKSRRTTGSIYGGFGNSRKNCINRKSQPFHC